jgi:polysaccharide pyruvyl transferase WcaK-like protein
MTTDKFEFDEYFYLNTYADVKAAVARGSFRSGFHHYKLCGIKEKRLAHAATNPGPKVYVCGAYGTNNVGDEAIFEGVNIEYPGAIQLYTNIPRVRNAVEMFSMWRGENKLESQDTVIIGGGGLLYNKAAVQNLIELCRRAAEAKATVKILGLGCEGAQEGFHEEIRELFDFADEISVRTTLSQEIVKTITGKTVERRDDFAFLLSKFRKARSQQDRVPIKRIGLITAGDFKADVTGFVKMIQKYSSPHSPKRRVKFIHIPHSASHVDMYNNDLIVGLKIRSTPSVWQVSDGIFFELRPFTDDPYEVLDAYSDLDAVISERFHGVIFGMMAQIPTLALGAANLKMRSLVEQYPSDRLVLSYSPRDLDAAAQALFAKL